MRFQSWRRQCHEGSIVVREAETPSKARGPGHSTPGHTGRTAMASTPLGQPGSTARALSSSANLPSFILWPPRNSVSLQKFFTKLPLLLPSGSVAGNRGTREAFPAYHSQLWKSQRREASVSTDIGISQLSLPQNTHQVREVIQLKHFSTQRDISAAAVCLVNVRVAHQGKAICLGTPELLVGHRISHTQSRDSVKLILQTNRVCPRGSPEGCSAMSREPCTRSAGGWCRVTGLWWGFTTSTYPTVIEENSETDDPRRTRNGFSFQNSSKPFKGTSRFLTKNSY